MKASRIVSLIVCAAMLCGCFVGCATTPATSTPDESTGEESTVIDPTGSTTVPSGSETTSPTEGTVTPTAPTTPTTSVVKPNGYQADQKYLYGVGYVHYSMGMKMTMSEAIGTIKALGAKSVRSWHNAYLTMSDYKTINPTSAAEYHTLYAEMRKNGVEQIIAVSHYWYTPGKETIAAMDIPVRDLTPGSEYMKFLEMYQATWKALSAEFPEVDGWEMGNEMNHDPFLHPMGYTGLSGSPVFTTEEKADITTDMIYYASKGISEGNPKAIAIMPAIAPASGSMNGDPERAYLTRIYENIKSGKWGSTNTNDFFEALSWHPYYHSCPDELWVLQQQSLHDIAANYGDGNKKVFFTEMGFADGGNASTDYKHYDWVIAAYDLIAKEMPWVESCHYYRLFDDGPDLYGLMNEPCKGFTAKEKGKAFQYIAGGKGDLDQYAVKFENYKPGDNVALRMPVKASSSCEQITWGLATSGVNDGNKNVVGWSSWYWPGDAEWVTNPGGQGAPTPTTQEYLQFEFPAFVDIDKVTLYSLHNVNNANSHKVQGVPRAWHVEVSDTGFEWTKVGEYRVNEADMKVYPDGVTYEKDLMTFTLNFDKTNARFVRIVFTELDPDWIYQPGSYYVQLMEVEIYKAK